MVYQYILRMSFLKVTRYIPVQSYSNLFIYLFLFSKFVLIKQYFPGCNLKCYRYVLSMNQLHSTLQNDLYDPSLFSNLIGHCTLKVALILNRRRGNDQRARRH